MVRIVNFLSVQLGQKDESERLIYLGRCVGKNIAYSDTEPILVKPCSVVEPYKRKELDLDLGSWCSRTELAVGSDKYLF